VYKKRGKEKNIRQSLGYDMRATLTVALIFLPAKKEIDMKKKIIIAVLAIISVLCCLLGLSACGGGNQDDETGNNQAGNDEHTHTYGSWTIIKKATCSEEGSRERTCTECNYIQTEIIEKKAHDFNNDNICRVCNYELEFTTGLEYVDYKQIEWPYSVGYMVTGLGTATNKDLVIPAYHADKPVLKIADSAFSGKDILTSVYIANTISEIGEKAFEYCTSMQKVTLSNGKRFTMGANAFYGCKKLVEITMPNVSMSIGDKAFYSTAYYNDAKNWEDGVLFIGKHLITTDENFTATNYTVGNDIVTIADKAFYGRNNLIEFNIPHNFQEPLTIGKSALLYSGIKKANFPYGYLGYLTATNITELTVNSIGTIYDLSKFVNVETLVVNGDWIDSRAGTGTEVPPLKGLGKLKNLTVEWLEGYYDSYCLGDLFGTTYYDGSIAVEQYAGKKNWKPVYKTCYIPANLKSVTVLSGAIPKYAFYNCNNIETINMGKDVSKIMENSIYGCSNLQSFNFIGSFEKFCTVEKEPCFNFTDKGKWIPFKVEGKVLQGKISISESVSEIVDGAFYGQDSITEITIPDGVKSIGNYAFWLCEKLTNIIIPNSVTSIGHAAFGRSGLKSITIPDGVTEIGGSAFEGCSSLTSITIPNSVTTIGNSAFYKCTDLTSITIPDGVTEIGGSAFEGCSSLTSITIPNSVTTIGNSAFYKCTGLTSITIPDNVTSIGKGAFSNTAYYNNEGNWRSGVLYIGNHLIKARETISGDYQIKSGTKTIAAYAFEGCIDLTSIIIPDGIITIGDYAFINCDRLTDIHFKGTKEQWKSIKKGVNWSFYAGNFTVHCSDGDLDKDGNEIIG